MINAIIIDDEQAALQALQTKIQMYCPEINIKAICDSSKAGLIAIKEHQPNVVFLDIEMPWMNGFEMLDCLGNNINFEVIFVTAYDQYAIRAFKSKALDYLLKPVDKDDLIECSARLQDSISNFSSEMLNELMQEMNKPMALKRILLHSMEGIEILDQNEINYCQADSNYTYVYTNSAKKIVVSKTLSGVEKLLNQNLFLRVHKSYTVNLSAIQRIAAIDGGRIVLKDKTEIPVSRRRKDQLFEALENLNF